MAGNIDTRTEIIGATGVVKLPNANFLFVITATGNVTFQLTRAGLAAGAAQENYTGNLGGLQISRVQRWDFASITGAVGVAITFMYGNVSIREDVTLFNQAIATISGVTAVATQPSSVVSTPAAQAVANTNKVSLAANLTRRRITICALSTNTGSVFVQAPAAGAGIGIELQPGTFTEFDTTAALDVRNDSGAIQTITTFEET
jgi:hypothetical protein